MGSRQPSRHASRIVRRQARSARHKSSLGEHRRTGARNHRPNSPRQKSALHHQIQGDDERGNSFERRAGKRRFHRRRIRPWRIHRAASQGNAVSHCFSFDAPDARRDQGFVPARTRRCAVGQSRRIDDGCPPRDAAKIYHCRCRFHRREFCHRRDRHDFHHGKRGQRAPHRRAAENDGHAARHRKSFAALCRPRAVSADARDRRAPASR